MYALVKTGGKQYRVAKNDTILVDRLVAEEGEQVILRDIVMLGDGDKITVGTPLVDGAAVSATVVRQTRGPKIIIFRRKRRKNHRRTQGHRQDLTLLMIDDIAADASNLKPPAKSTPKAAAKKAAPKAEQQKRQRQRRQEKSSAKGGSKKSSAKGGAAKKAAPKAVAAKKAPVKKAATKK